MSHGGRTKEIMMKITRTNWRPQVVDELLADIAEPTTPAPTPTT